jgi:hypothetical protein
MTMLPARSDPDSMWAWWRFPAAGLPRIGITVPTMISTNPDMRWAGANASAFDNGPWWGDLYYYLFSLNGPDSRYKHE